MAAREPSWWYGRPALSWQALALAPFGWIYGAVSGGRMQSGSRYRSSLPVICIGNFTAGGTGKTPFVGVVCEILRRQGHTPVVLSRGYGGSLAGPHWVDVAVDTAAAVGDEPLLMAGVMPVVVARDRVLGARAIEGCARAGLQPTVIVMDDGIQNPALNKALSIAVVDVSRGVGNGRCIPAGPLRAPLHVQFPRVDAVLLNGGDGSGPRAPSTDALLRQFGGPALSAVIAPAGDLAWLRGTSVIAFAGIGAPERFFSTALACGATLREKIVFGDHHAFSEADARRLLALADATGAELLTTEKDFARLGARSGALADLRVRTRTLPITLLLDASSHATLAGLLHRHAPISAATRA